MKQLATMAESIPDTPPEVWVTITRYAVLYGVTRPTVYKWLECGLLEYYQAGAVVRVKNQLPRSVNPRKF